MHPRVYQEFERICSKRKIEGCVLEVGAVPNDSSLLTMRCLQNCMEKIGLNIDGPIKYKDFHILKGNANSMDFESDKFDCVLCNAVLEHDKFFWKAISEIKRVTKPGGLIVIGVPAFKEFPIDKYLRFIGRLFPFINRYLNFLTSTTITFQIHNAPGDYYRFSSQVFQEVFFDGMKDVNIKAIMLPPRIIGFGIKPQINLIRDL